MTRGSLRICGNTDQILWVIKVMKKLSCFQHRILLIFKAAATTSKLQVTPVTFKKFKFPVKTNTFWMKVKLVGLLSFQLIEKLPIVSKILAYCHCHPVQDHSKDCRQISTGSYLKKYPNQTPLKRKSEKLWTLFLSLKLRYINASIALNHLLGPQN